MFHVAFICVLIVRRCVVSFLNSTVWFSTVIPGLPLALSILEGWFYHSDSLDTLFE